MKPTPINKHIISQHFYFKKVIALLLVLSMIILVSCNRNKPEGHPVQNIILMIGDGMGIAHIYAAMTANKGQLQMARCKVIGFSKTQSKTNYITDSAAGATAMATGKKTYNGAISVDTDSLPLQTILEIAENNGLSTGLVSTSSITHATPACFIAHTTNRNNYEEIAACFLQTDIDVFIGGGYKHFSERKDGRNLINQLEKKNYTVLQSLQEATAVNSGKLAVLTAKEHPPRLSEGRKNELMKATRISIELLSSNKKGFFLMVEGSQIDWGGHENDTRYIVEETLDFDQAVGYALDYAEKQGNTLVIITADHETGGMGLTGGNIAKGHIEATYVSHGHTGEPVPVLAFGPGAEEFAGFYENTGIFDKCIEAMGW
jgi:alkaline phosphatase